MSSKEPCQPLQLASNLCCEVVCCPQCHAVHLHIGPISLKLPLNAFQEVSSALAEAAERLKDHLPAAHQPQSSLGDARKH